jgi:hypothetical protein
MTVVQRSNNDQQEIQHLNTYSLCYVKQVEELIYAPPEWMRILDRGPCLADGEV